MEELLRPQGPLDATLRIVVAAALFVWLIYEGSVIHSPYSQALVQLYDWPLWRLAVVIFVFLGALWCPRVGILAALAVFFYVADLETLRQPLQNS